MYNCVLNTYVEEIILHICLISVEIFAWGKYGGFGRATRIIGRELTKRGIQVSAIVPQRNGQQSIEELDGVKVFAFKPTRPIEMWRLYQKVGKDVDIFHSQEPSFGTYLAWQANPDKQHIVTFRDTRLVPDWWTEFNLPSLNRLQVLANWFYEDNPFVHRVVRRVNERFVAANLLKDLAVKKYRLKTVPELLPTPVKIPEQVKKAEKPTVCFVARWDRRKRPELFFELAKKFPQVRFLASGYSRDKNWDTELRKKYGSLPNVEMIGFSNQFENANLSHVLEQSWILVNTSAREGLPNSFIEAAAHRCAILSAVDPDQFASRFGCQAAEDDFEKGLSYLIEKNNWQEKGQLGYKYVRDVYSLENAVDQHIAVYEHLLHK